VHWKATGALHLNPDYRIALGRFRGTDRPSPPLLIPTKATKLERLEWVAREIDEHAGVVSGWPYGVADSDPLPPGARLNVIRVGSRPDYEALEDSEDDSRVSAAGLRGIRVDQAWGDAHVDPVTKRPAPQQGGHAQTKHPRTGTYEPIASSRRPYATRQTRGGGEIIFDGISEDPQPSKNPTNQRPQNSLYTVQDEVSRDPTSQDTEIGDAHSPSRPRQVLQRPRVSKESQYGPPGPVPFRKAVAQNTNSVAKILKAVGKTGVMIELDDLFALKEINSELFTYKHWHYDEERQEPIHQPHAPKGGIRSATAGGESAGRVGAVQTNPMMERPLGSRLYQSNCPYLPVKIRGQYEDSLLDTGAEINLMSLGLVQEMGLSQYMRKPKFVQDAVGFSGERERFAGMIEGFVVNVAGVDVLTNVYVAATMDQAFRFILGVPFQKAANGNIYYQEDGRCVVSLTDSFVGKRITMIAQDAPDTEGNELRELARTSSLKGVAGTNGRRGLYSHP
jgi:hypothetical protein